MVHPEAMKLFLTFLVSANALAADISHLETLKLSSGPASISVRFTAPGKGWTGTLLSRRAAPGEPSLTVTAFKHEPFGNRFLGVAMDGTADGPNQVAAKTVRDDIIGGHLVGAFTEMDAALDSGPHELVFRSDGKTAELSTAFDVSLAARKGSPHALI